MLDPRAKTLAQGRNFAALTTLLPSGQPMTQVMWVDADDDHLLINTEVGRQKFANVRHDPRVTVTIIEDGNPYHYVEARGRVVDSVTGPVARDQLEALSQKYTGAPYANPIETERVVLHIVAERVRANG